MRELNKEDIKFLRNLQHEMNTQDTVGQSDPRFWVVMQTVRECWIDNDNDVDGVFIYDADSCETVFEDEWNKLPKWIRDNVEGIVKAEHTYGGIEIEDEYEDYYYIQSIIDLREFLKEKGFDEYYTSCYVDRDEIVKDTMFLTKRECEEHIKRNHYHYNKPHPYAMTAWRSPQVEKLYEILHNVDWTIFNDDTNDYEALPRNERVTITLPVKCKLVVEERKKREIKLDEE